MAANLAHRLIAVEESQPATDSYSAVKYEESPSVCAFSYSTGMEVVSGK